MKEKINIFKMDSTFCTCFHFIPALNSKGKLCRNHVHSQRKQGISCTAYRQGIR